MLRVRNLGV